MRRLFMSFLVVIMFCIFCFGDIHESVAEQVSGSWNFQGSAGFFKANSADVGTLNGSLSVGYFFTPRVEVGLRQGLNYEFVTGGANPWLATTVPYVNFHFLTGVFQPYIGAGVGVVWNNSNVTGTIAPSAGFKAFVADNVYVNVGYTYEWFFTKIDYNTVIDESSRGNHVIGVGVGILF